MDDVSELAAWLDTSVERGLCISGDGILLHNILNKVRRIYDFRHVKRISTVQQECRIAQHYVVFSLLFGRRLGQVVGVGLDE